MNEMLTSILQRALATDSPLLPALPLQQVWLHLGWSLVLAMLGSSLAGCLQMRRPAQRLVALALAAWCWIPGVWGASFWLGLAFQAPSAVSACLCAVFLARGVSSPSTRSLVHPRTSLYLPVLGVVMGWALLLDSFAVLPWQIYSLGFSPTVPVLVIAIAVFPWVIGWSHGVSTGVGVGGLWLAVALVIFLTLRLPSGNAWDALLDPWLWLVLHGLCIGVLRQRRASVRLAKGQPT